MSQMWRRVVVLLVVIIAALQVIHMTLLSRLEAKKNHREATSQQKWVASEPNYRETDVTASRAKMFQQVHRSSVLDSSGEFRIVNFVIRGDWLGPKSNVREDISLVTQCTPNHLQMLPTLVDRWCGPVSVTVFASARDIPSVIESVLFLRQCYHGIRRNVSFHLVYPLKSPGQDETVAVQPLPLGKCDSFPKKFDGENYANLVPYPNNLLRNVARRNSLTEFVFVADVDMVPNENLHTEFHRFARESRLFMDSYRDDKTAYVVPAFELREGHQFPRDKAALLQLVEQGVARPFYYELCWKCQKHTDYDAWQREPVGGKLAVMFEVLWRDPWEPFFVSRNSAPLYDERFRQYGFNRISQVCELHVAGYKFSVLNNAFLTHRGLKTATSFHKEKENDQERNRILFRQFKTELKEKYPDSSRRCY